MKSNYTQDLRHLKDITERANSLGAHTILTLSETRMMHKAAQHLLAILEAVENGAKLVDGTPWVIGGNDSEDEKSFARGYNHAIDAAPCKIKALIEGSE